jgi:molybdopterin/thiamine biosynthesis adenylyltransferase
MRVTIPQSVVRHVAGQGVDRGSGNQTDETEAGTEVAKQASSISLLCGRRLDEGDVLQVSGVREWSEEGGDPTEQVGSSVPASSLAHRSKYYNRDEDASLTGLLPATTSDDTATELMTAGAEAAVVVDPTQLGPESPVPDEAVDVRTADGMGENAGVDIETEIIRYSTDAFDRIEALVDNDVLDDTTVTIVGVGTGGGAVAVELAKAGVGGFHLIDYDRLETHNITRHVCGLSDVGRLKSLAVRDRLLDINPTADVDTHEMDVVERQPTVTGVVADSDLVVVATDNELSKLAVNRACVEAEVPAVFAGAYERGDGGDVIRVVPGETPCYDCIMGDVQDSLDYEEKAGPVDYSAADEPGDVAGEPGLSVDVGFVWLIQTKYALLTLLRDHDTDLDDYEEDMCFWGTRPVWIFDGPLQSQFADTVYPETPCRTCQREAYYEEVVGMSREEAQKLAAEAVAEADELQLDGIGGESGSDSRASDRSDGPNADPEEANEP